MIDPTRMTDYNRTVHQLEETLLFCIAVAGKNAKTTAKLLDKLLMYGGHNSKVSPFQAIASISKQECLATVMQTMGFGCYGLKSRGFLAAIEGKLNLKTCTVDDLEKLPGIGMKTSRFFILHCRKDANIACLDTHILKWLAYHTDLKVPKQTPSKRLYLYLERVFLDVAKALKTDPATLDLKIWNQSSGSLTEK